MWPSNGGKLSVHVSGGALHISTCGPQQEPPRAHLSVSTASYLHQKTPGLQIAK